MTHRVLIVGLGQIGMGYDLDLPESFVLSHARAFTGHPDFEVVGGVDPSEDRRELFGQRYGKPGFTDVTSAVKETRPDLVVIACPTPLHGAALRSAIGGESVRAILCEKPLSYHIGEARKMVADCEAADRHLFVNYARRSEPGAIEIGARISDSRIAGPLKGVAWYTKGLFHTGSHFFNLVEMWLGPMSEFSVIDRGRKWGESDVEPDVRVRFARGTVDFLAAREECFSHHEIELVAGNGRLKYEQGGAKIEWQQAVTDPATPEFTVLSTTPGVIPSDPERSQWHVTEEIGKALSEHAANLCDGRTALNTLESLTAISDRL